MRAMIYVISAKLMALVDNYSNCVPVLHWSRQMKSTLIHGILWIGLQQILGYENYSLI